MILGCWSADRIYCPCGWLSFVCISVLWKSAKFCCRCTKFWPPNIWGFWFGEGILYPADLRELHFIIFFHVTQDLQCTQNKRFLCKVCYLFYFPPGENLTFVIWEFEYRVEKVYGLWTVFLLWSHSMKARKQGDKLHVNMVVFWSLRFLEIISYWRILMPSWTRIWETTQQKQSRMVFQGSKMHLLIVF